jgi:hypothetical protein
VNWESYFMSWDMTFRIPFWQRLRFLFQGELAGTLQAEMRTTSEEVYLDYIVTSHGFEVRKPSRDACRTN